MTIPGQPKHVGRRGRRTGDDRSEDAFRADLRAAFEHGATGAPPTAAEGYWRTVGFIEPEDDDVTEFVPTEPSVVDLGEIHHEPVRDDRHSHIHELQEAPIIDAVIVDDDDASH